jgi:hypothetical protein
MLAGPILTPVVFLEDKAFSAKWPALPGRPRLRLGSLLFRGLRRRLQPIPFPGSTKPRHAAKPSKIPDVNFNTVACRCRAVSQPMTLSDAGPAVNKQTELQHLDAMRTLAKLEPD